MMHLLHFLAFLFLCLACLLFIGSWIYRDGSWSWKHIIYGCLFITLIVGEGLDLYFWPARGPQPSIPESFEGIEAGFQFVFGVMVLGLLFFDWRYERKKEEKDEVLEDLAESLEEKKVLIGEIHHRVKNNLQVMLSLIRLRRRKLDQSDVEREFKKLESKILSIAMIHETLYEQGDQSHVQADRYFEDLVREIGDLYGGGTPKEFQLRHDVDSFPLEMSRAISCGIVVSELIFNAFEHASGQDSSGGWIKVGVKLEDGDRVVVTVTDNGEQSLSGSEFWSADSLGHRVIRNVTNDQLNGQIVLEESHPRNSFRIQFPYQSN